MPKTVKPRILIVDDEPDEARPRKMEIGNQAHVDIIHPEDITEREQFTDVHLILVDFRLDNWRSRDKVPSLSQRPMDGLALAAVLRSHIDGQNDSAPIAIAIHSAHLRDLSGGLPPEPRAHAIARAHNLEWAFSKRQGGDEVSLAQQIISLATAVSGLPSSWPTDKPNKTEEQVQQLLAIPQNAIWFDRAWRDIHACYPPIHELSKWSHGLAILRWLLQRILPYPCFLWDSHYLAARLRVTNKSLTDVLDTNEKFARVLAPFQYRGILGDFLGHRWWRSGIESFLWVLTEGNPFDLDLIRSQLVARIGAKLSTVDLAQPIVCVDKDYRVLPKFFHAEDAVRIQPDDWPPYADQAWTTIELARQERSLRSLVVTEDEAKLR